MAHIAMKPAEKLLRRHYLKWLRHRSRWRKHATIYLLSIAITVTSSLKSIVRDLFFSNKIFRWSDIYCLKNLIKMGDNFGIHRGPARGGAAGTEERTQGQILSDFLVQLEDYTPTVRNNNKNCLNRFISNSNNLLFRFQMLLHRTIWIRRDSKHLIHECKNIYCESITRCSKY